MEFPAVTSGALRAANWLPLIVLRPRSSWSGFYPAVAAAFISFRPLYLCCRHQATDRSQMISQQMQILPGDATPV